MKNQVTLLLVIDVGDMTAKQFDQAVKNIRGYAASLVEVDGGKLLGHSERPSYLPKEKKSR